MTKDLTDLRCGDGIFSLPESDPMTPAFPEVNDLLNLLTQPQPIDFERFARIPGITPRKLKALHAKHLKARNLEMKK